MKNLLSLGGALTLLLTAMLLAGGCERESPAIDADKSAESVAQVAVDEQAPTTAPVPASQPAVVESVRAEAIALMMSGDYAAALDVYLNAVKELTVDQQGIQRELAIEGLALAQVIVSQQREQLGAGAELPAAPVEPADKRPRIQRWAEDVSQQERFAVFAQEFAKVAQSQHSGIDETISDERLDLRRTDSEIHPTRGVVSYIGTSGRFRTLYVVEFVEEDLWWNPVGGRSVSVNALGQPTGQWVNHGESVYLDASHTANNAVTRLMRLDEP